MAQGERGVEAVTGEPAAGAPGEVSGKPESEIEEKLDHRSPHTGHGLHPPERS